MDHSTSLTIQHEGGLNRTAKDTNKKLVSGSVYKSDSLPGKFQADEDELYKKHCCENHILKVLTSVGHMNVCLRASFFYNKESSSASFVALSAAVWWPCVCLA